MYPRDDVSEFLGERFVPVKIHVKEQPQTFDRFGAQWTPTMAVLDPGGTERHRWEGFLPADEFLAQLELGLARVALGRNELEEAEREFRDVAERYPDTQAAPQALYWAGVSRYKLTDEGEALAEAGRQLEARYPGSEWATKASVWRG